MRESSMGWGRRELGAWLMCQYGQCVMAREPSEPVSSHDPPPPNEDSDESATQMDVPAPHDSGIVVTRRKRVSEFDVVDLVHAARSFVQALLVDLADRERAENICRLLIARGQVVALRDSGGTSYAAVDLPRMRLTQRLAALFVADYLNSPFDYQQPHGLVGNRSGEESDPTVGIGVNSRSH